MGCRTVAGGEPARARTQALALTNGAISFWDRAHKLLVYIAPAETRSLRRPSYVESAMLQPASHAPWLRGLDVLPQLGRFACRVLEQKARFQHISLICWIRASIASVAPAPSMIVVFSFSMRTRLAHPSMLPRHAPIANLGFSQRADCVRLAAKFVLDGLNALLRCRRGVVTLIRV